MAASRDNTVREVLGEARQALGHLDNARLEAEILLAAVTGSRREHFYAEPEQPLPADRCADYRALVRHRSQGMPVAYLTGEREFWSLPFKVNRETLIPRPETELLVAAALDRIPAGAGLGVLDLGTGCGAIAVALAVERPDCRITAVDISPAALEVARQNAAAAGAGHIEFIRSDWFSDLPPGRFHVILANPPYVESEYPGFASEEIRFEPRLALDGGPAGLRSLQQIIPAARRRLHAGGVLLLEHGHRQGAAVRGLMHNNHYAAPRTLTDLAGLERVTLAVSA